MLFENIFIRGLLYSVSKELELIRNVEAFKAQLEVLYGT